MALSDIGTDGLADTLRRVRTIQGGERAGLRAKGYRLDVTLREAVFAHADEVRSDFGTAHFVINNAGASLLGTVEHQSIEEIEWQLAINLWGVIYGTKAFLPIMLAQREGCIVNISSVLGLLSLPNQSAYAMSKFAVRALTECLWSELAGTGVRAVSVHPGGIRTHIANNGRVCAAAGPQEAAFGEWIQRVLLRTTPEECAKDILQGIRRRIRRILTGKNSRAGYWISRLTPNGYPDLMRRIIR
ncbi:SDR family NAD(P)-dependent oxidoreductase [Cupriavidus sp. 8B]